MKRAPLTPLAVGSDDRRLYSQDKKQCSHFFFSSTQGDRHTNKQQGRKVEFTVSSDHSGLDSSNNLQLSADGRYPLNRLCQCLMTTTVITNLEVLLLHWRVTAIMNTFQESRQKPVLFPRGGGGGVIP